MIAKVEGNSITTVDGNSGGIGAITVTHRSRADFAAFYRIPTP